MIETRFIPRTLIDTEGHIHLIETRNNDSQFLLDGQCASIEATDQGTIRLQVPLNITISCSAAHFWHAFAGNAQPTAEEAGNLLASLFIQRTNSQRLVESLHTLKSSLNSTLTSMPQAPTWPLPTYHLDPFIAQALEIYDGNPETTQILARLLKQPEENIRSWATLLGKTTPAPTSTLLDQSTSDQQESEPPIEISSSQEGEAPRGNFRWSTDLVERLKNAFNAFAESDPEPTTAAKIQAIAQEHQWPLSAVRYKVYELGLSQIQRARSRETGNLSTETEGDQRWPATATPTFPSAAQGGNTRD